MKKVSIAQKFQFVFVHDHTASMGGLRVQVRAKNCATINKLFELIGEHLEVGVITVCDRHDVPGERDMKEVLLTKDREKIIQHINTVPDALGNSSWEECYERVFRRLREFPWDPKAIKVVVFTGDSQPHPLNHFKNPERLDWRKEVRSLVNEQNVIFYPVYALTFCGQGGNFWQELAQIGNGVMLTLDQFDHITPYLLGIAARASGHFDSWERNYITRSKNCIPYAVQRSFDSLAGRAPKRYSSRNAGKSVAVDGRFQVFKIEERVRADEFFKELGIIEHLEDYKFHRGELFYAHESRASELVRPQHEVILEDDASGEKVFGKDARKMIGIPYGTKESKLGRNQFKQEGYTIWIQSRSVSNCRFLERNQRVMVDLHPKAGFEK